MLEVDGMIWDARQANFAVGVDLEYERWILLPYLHLRNYSAKPSRCRPNGDPRS